MIAEQKNWNKDSEYSIQETIFQNQEQKHRNKDSQIWNQHTVWLIN